MRGWLAIVAAMMAATPALAADVVVTLTGVKAKGGAIHVALYDEATFLRAAAPAGQIAPVTAAGDVVVTFHGVAPGNYAIAGFHDTDGDARMTMANGRIAEGTALSNADKLRGPPSFAVAKVAVPASGLKITLPMSYPEDRRGW